MTFEEIDHLLSLAGAFGIGGILFGLVVFLLLKSFLPSYLAKKAENLATREDIAAITHEVERVRTEYAALLEELKARHQLRLAAVDRRLEAHQEAFSLWRELLAAVHTDEIGKVVLKCQAWWEKNCLFLEPKVREAFVSSYSAANTHHALVQGRADARDITQNWSAITNFPNTLFEAIQLPTLTELEAKPIEIVDKNDAALHG